MTEEIINVRLTRTQADTLIYGDRARSGGIESLIFHDVRDQIDAVEADELARERAEVTESHRSPTKAGGTEQPHPTGCDVRDVGEGSGTPVTVTCDDPDCQEEHSVQWNEHMALMTELVVKMVDSWRERAVVKAARAVDAWAEQRWVMLRDDKSFIDLHRALLELDGGDRPVDGTIPRR